MKKCTYCKSQFTPSHNKGHEQLYCSKTCQSKAAQIRHKERLLKKIQEEVMPQKNNTKEVITTYTFYKLCAELVNFGKENNMDITITIN